MDYTHSLYFQGPHPPSGEAYFSMTQFPHLGHEDGISMHLMGLLRQLNGLWCVKFKTLETVPARRERSTNIC